MDILPLFNLSRGDGANKVNEKNTDINITLAETNSGQRQTTELNRTEEKRTEQT